MRIKKLEITNWGPHKHRSFNMDTSIVGIIGTNGKGKSNLLQAIDYALTGNLNKQKQEKYIRNFGQADGATTASVRVLFEKDGKEGDITRTITATGSRRKLKWDNSEWTKAADVDRIMEEIIGVDKASLAQAVFVKQGELARIIKGTPAERQTLFQKLMNLSFIEPRVDDITAKIAALRGSLQDIRPTLTLAENDLQVCVLDMQELESAKAISDKFDHAISQLRTLAFDVHATQTSVAPIPGLQKQLHNAQSSLALKLKDLQLTSEDELKALHKTATEDLRIKTAQLEECRNYKQLLAERQRLIDIIAFNKKELKEKFEYVTYPDYFFDNHNALKELQSKLADDLDLAHNIQRHTDDCLALTTKYHRDFEEWSDAVAKAKEDLPEIRHQLQETAQLHAQLIIDIAYAEARESIFEVGGNLSVCPLCGHDMNKQAVMLPGESEGDTKRRLHRETQELHAKKLSVSDSITSLSNYIIACESTLALPDPTIAYEEAVAPHKDYLNKTREAAAALNGTPASIQAECLKVQVQLTDLANQRAQYVTIEDIIAAHEGKLSKLPEPEACNYNETDLIREVNRLTQLVAEHKGNIEIIDRLKHAITLADSQLTEARVAYQERMDRMTNQLTQVEQDDIVVECWHSIDPEEKYNRTGYNDLMTITQLMIDTKTEYDQDAAKYDQLAEQKEKLILRVHSLKELIAKNEEKQTLIDDLNVAKSMIMRTGVPLAFMNDVFNKLVGIVQETLTRMGSNFNVIPDPDRACSFLFVRTDNDSKFEMQQEQLSGGQAIRLALALLLACQQLILPDIGLLVLDEPSSHIDSEGVEQMRDLFISLRSILQNTHMQLIIVDHNDKLTTSFETTIVL